MRQAVTGRGVNLADAESPPVRFLNRRHSRQKIRDVRSRSRSDKTGDAGYQKNSTRNQK